MTLPAREGKDSVAFTNWEYAYSNPESSSTEVVNVKIIGVR
jgi:hypothetical protein